VQLNLSKEEWLALRKLATRHQFKAWLKLLEDKLHKAEQDYLHKPLQKDFERGKASGKLKLIKELVNDCRAAEKAEMAEGQLKELREVEQKQVQAMIKKSELKRII